MKVLTPGYKYLAQNLDDKENGQTIQFIEKIPVSDGSTDLKTVNDGTTNEELLDILIDRVAFLNKKMVSIHNKKAIMLLNAAKAEFTKRTRRRKARGVEGTAAA